MNDRDQVLVLIERGVRRVGAIEGPENVTTDCLARGTAVVKHWPLAEK
jgi:hypothetical protein